METSARNFETQIATAEKLLSEQIDYLSEVCVGASHEGTAVTQVAFLELNLKVLIFSCKEVLPF